MNRRVGDNLRALAAAMLALSGTISACRVSVAQAKSIVIDDLTITDFDRSRATQKPPSFHITGPHTRLKAKDPDSKAVINVQSPDITGSSSNTKEADVITFAGPVFFTGETAMPRL